MAVIRCCKRQFDLNLITVEPGLFLYMLTFFLTNLTYQAFVYDKVCTDKYNETFCTSLRNKTFQEDHQTEEDYVQSETSYWILKKNVVERIPSGLIVVFILGSWGDKVGRKLPAILPSVGATLSSTVYLILSIYPSSKVEYVMIAGALNGLSGGFTAMIMAVNSYVTHIANPTNRTTRLGILEAVIFLAGTVGVFTSGVMLDNTSFTFVFAFMSGCSFLGIVYFTLRLENLTAITTRLESESFCEYWILGSIKESGRCVMKKRHGKRTLWIVLLLIVFNLQVIAAVLPLISMFQGFTSTAIRSLLPSLVNQDEQGRAFGLVAALNSIAVLVASLLFNELYPATLDFFPGLSFMLAAGLSVVAGVIILWLHYKLRGLVLDNTTITKSTSGDTDSTSKGDIQVETATTHM